MTSPYQFLPRLWSNWITLLGAILTTCSGLAIVLVIAIELVSSGTNPYAGGLLLLALPFLFATGLLIIPLGLYIDRRARAKLGAAAPPNLMIEALRTAVNQRSTRRLMLFFAGATVVNVVLFGAAGQRTVHRMDTAQFCGTTCHVMQPEWASYSSSQHSRVACVQCHIGPGASWAVKAKINGLKQVWGVLAGTYDRPIPTPVEHLRPSRDTCEECHWPEKFTGSKLVVLPHFMPDKTNTPAYNVLRLRVGGRDPKTQKYEGIHWHVSVATEVRYEVLDPARSKVGRITVVEGGKVVSEYLPPAKDRGLPVLSQRTMDCVDCHNRPTHVFDENANAAVDRAMFAGQLDPTVPYLVKVARAVLERPDLAGAGSDAAALGRFRTALAETFQTTYPEVKPAPEVLDQAARTLAELYEHNVYPKMNVSWGTYRSRLGHKHDGEKAEEVGCFRCHDGEHEKITPSGKKQTLSHSCELCHETIVAGEDPSSLDPELKQLVRR